MRLVRKFAFLLVILSLAAVPFIGAGCTDQGTAKPPAGDHAVDAGKKTDAPKSPKKKGRSDEGGSTTGDLGVKPPKVPADNKAK
jgi:hypothetical protein